MTTLDTIKPNNTNSTPLFIPSQLVVPGILSRPASVHPHRSTDVPVSTVPNSLIDEIYHSSKDGEISIIRGRDIPLYLKLTENAASTDE